MTYTFTYSINTHSIKEYQGKKVISQIMYTIAVTRSDGKSCNLELSINYPLDCATKVIPYTRQKYDGSDNVIAESEYTDRTDFKEYDDLNLPNAKEIKERFKRYNFDDQLVLDSISPLKVLAPLTVTSTPSEFASVDILFPDAINV